ncbi:MAG: amidohydrolase family protein [Planctomycetes bacterium]|nr:amidohydrolase family protein [Planctomycetota bacterium]
MVTVDRAELNEAIRTTVMKAGLCDVHEHLLSRRQRADRDPGLLEWINSSYLWADLVSAGLDTTAFLDASTPFSQRWSALEEVLPAVRHTGYMEVCRRAWGDLCGMEGRHLDARSAGVVDAAIRQHNRDQAFSDAVLVGRCGVRRVLVDYQVGGTAVHFFGQTEERDWYRYLLCVRPKLSEGLIGKYTIVRELDLSYARPVVKIDSLFYGWLEAAASENHQLLGVDTSRARDLDGWSGIIETAVRQAAGNGAVGLKNAHNCCRSPVLGPVDRRAAETVLRSRVDQLSPAHIIAFENFVFHEVARCAAQYGLPLQIHTGTTYGAGGLSSARAGSAELLAEFIQSHPQTTFVLMHASWPYWGELEQMAKRYANLHLDLSWAFMLGPTEAIRMMQSMWTSLPASKLLWGGDCYYVEESYGALVQARRVVTEALARLMEMDQINEAEAIDLAVRLFCTNGLKVFPRAVKDARLHAANPPA